MYSFAKISENITVVNFAIKDMPKAVFEILSNSNQITTIEQEGNGTFIQINCRDIDSFENAIYLDKRIQELMLKYTTK